MTDLVVAQLHRALVNALRRTRPAELDRSVTVAEIYQDLVPYRVARSDIGFEMNADYEHALLRLLAGEGDLARIEPREVRDKLRLELESANPDVGLYRSYAACDVWVNVDEAGEVSPSNEEEPLGWEEEFVGPSSSDVEGAAPIEAYAPGASNEDDRDADVDDEPDQPEPQPGPAPAARVRPAFQIASEGGVHGHKPLPADEDADTCVVCGGELPEGRMVNFCPFCGSDQSQQPCPTCGEMLEPLWRFCVACGTRVRSADDVN